MAMNEMCTKYTAWKGQNAGSPSFGARQNEIPSECGSLPMECRIVKQRCGQSFKCIVRLIIGAHGAVGAQFERPHPQIFRGSFAGCSGGYSTRFHRRFRHLSVESFYTPLSVRFGHRQSLLRRAAEKRENPIHLRPASARELRERFVPALRHAAVLVPQTAS